jgi:hypothetical protein
MSGHHKPPVTVAPNFSRQSTLAPKLLPPPDRISGGLAMLNFFKKVLDYRQRSAML